MKFVLIRIENSNYYGSYVKLSIFCILGDPKYTPHIVELAVWTHYILYDLKPELLENMPEAKVDKGVASAAAAPADPVPVATPEVATPAAPEEPSENNGQVSATISADEDTKSSMASSVDEDSNSAKNHNNTHSSNSAETVRFQNNSSGDSGSMGAADAFAPVKVWQ